MMEMRRFVDAAHVPWEVVAVHPQARAQPPTGARGERSSGLPPPDEGWLFFRSRLGEWRRLTPIPADWLRASNAQLAAYCEAAEVVGTFPQ